MKYPLPYMKKMVPGRSQLTCNSPNDLEKMAMAKEEIDTVTDKLYLTPGLRKKKNNEEVEEGKEEKFNNYLLYGFHG